MDGKLSQHRPQEVREHQVAHVLTPGVQSSSIVLKRQLVRRFIMPLDTVRAAFPGKHAQWKRDKQPEEPMEYRMCPFAHT